MVMKGNMLIKSSKPVNTTRNLEKKSQNCVCVCVCVCVCITRDKFVTGGALKNRELFSGVGVTCACQSLRVQNVLDCNVRIWTRL
jgi:hypothetical protein